MELVSYPAEQYGAFNSGIGIGKGQPDGRPFEGFCETVCYQRILPNE